MSCCKTISTQQDVARKMLRWLDEPSKDDAVLTRRALKVVGALRDMLGTYHVDPRLTHRFRLEVEPALANVFTRVELESYLRSTLRPFGKDVHDALQKWKDKYCRA